MFKTLKRLGSYMGGRKYLLPCSVALSAVNGLLSLVPFVLLWLVVRTLLIAKGNLSDTPLIDYWKGHSALPPLGKQDLPTLAIK